MPEVYPQEEEDTPPKSIWQLERDRRLQKEKEKMEKEGKQTSTGFDVEQSKPGTSRGEQEVNVGHLMYRLSM